MNFATLDGTRWYLEDIRSLVLPRHVNKQYLHTFVIGMSDAGIHSM